LQFAICNLQFAIPLLFLLLFCGFLFFYRLGERSLGSSHEARAGQNAQSILDDHSWGLPRLFDRRVELQKPPLYYWLVALLAALGGGRVDAWAIRLPAALAGLGGVVLVFALYVRRGRPRAGLLAAAALATMVHYTWLARVGRIDMPLTLTVAVALAGFHLGWCRRRQRHGRAGWRWFLISYVAVAVGLLLKGPIAAVLPAAVAGVQLLAAGELSFLWTRTAAKGRALGRLAHELGLWWGIPLTLVLAAPWFLAANAWTEGELFRVFFWYHNVERGFGGSGGLSAHPWWFYGPRLLLDLFPWSLLLPVALWSFVKSGGWHEDSEARFGLVWLLTVVVLLSCLRFKRADYLLPAYPGAALFLGAVAQRWYGRARRKRLAVAFGLVLAACVLSWWSYLHLVLPRQEAERPYRQFAAVIRRLAPHPQPIFFFRAEAHALAFYVGRPVGTLMEWENLDIWIGRSKSVYVIMPPDCARAWSQHLKAGPLEIVLRTTDLVAEGPDRPLVLQRTLPRRDTLAVRRAR
jgi:4-amino-4-deoxy-L-arabinose transferase-like glycosyltransferase